MLKEHGITRIELSEKYFGINMQSNWAVSWWDEEEQKDKGLYQYEF